MYSISSKIKVGKLSVEELENFNPGNNICVLYSNSVDKLFDVKKILDSLGENRLIKSFNHIRPDAPFEDLDKVLEDCKNNQIDTVIAIGGGSIVDAAKALSVAFGAIDYKDIFYKKAEMPTVKIPVIAVPTTAGTGAELSFGAIIYDAKNKVKGGLRGPILQPDYVLIDPDLHNSCPFKLKAEVGFDCLTHAVETYISNKSNPIVQLKSIECIKAVFEYLPSACEESDQYSMSKLAIHSALMGINLAYSSTCLPHRLQYVIGPLTGTSHAQGLIALYKGWLVHLHENDINNFNELCHDLKTTPEKFINDISMLKKRLNIDYSLTTLGVKSDQIEDISKAVSGNLEADPSYKDNESIINILKKSI